MVGRGSILLLVLCAAWRPRQGDGGASVVRQRRLGRGGGRGGQVGGGGHGPVCAGAAWGYRGAVQGHVGHAVEVACVLAV